MTDPQPAEQKTVPATDKTAPVPFIREMTPEDIMAYAEYCLKDQEMSLRLQRFHQRIIDDSNFPPGNSKGIYQDDDKYELIKISEKYLCESNIGNQWMSHLNVAYLLWSAVRRGQIASVRCDDAVQSIEHMGNYRVRSQYVLDHLPVPEKLKTWPNYLEAYTDYLRYCLDNREVVAMLKRVGWPDVEQPLPNEILLPLRAFTRQFLREIDADEGWDICFWSAHGVVVAIVDGKISSLESKAVEHNYYRFFNFFPNPGGVDYAFAKKPAVKQEISIAEVYEFTEACMKDPVLAKYAASAAFDEYEDLSDGEYGSEKHARLADEKDEAIFAINFYCQRHLARQGRYPGLFHALAAGIEVGGQVITGKMSSLYSDDATELIKFGINLAKNY